MTSQCALKINDADKIAGKDEDFEVVTKLTLVIVVKLCSSSYCGYWLVWSRKVSIDYPLYEFGANLK